MAISTELKHNKHNQVQAMINAENTAGYSEAEADMCFIKETHTLLNFSLKEHPETVENITVKRELDDFDNRETANDVDLDLDQKSTIKLPSHISEEENLETHTEEKFSLENHPFTAEIKREPDDFDDRITANQVDQNINEKSIIKRHSPIKSEEESLINSQYLVSHDEFNIKSEDDEEQSDSRFKNHKVGHILEDEIKIHKCPDCAYESKRKNDIKTHSVRHKKPDEIVWHRCTECPFKTDRKPSLKRHAFVHNETGQFKIFKCAHCVYETARMYSLKRHLVVHRREENITWIYCPEPECHYKTYDKANLRRHSSVHNSDQFFKCTQSPKKTIRKKSLQVPVLKHANPDELERYNCEQCPYTTYRKDCFKEHELTHNNDYAKWLQCTYCSFRTLRKDCLRRHQVIHQDTNGPGWHKCPECPYKAIRKDQLLRHAKNHKAADQTDWWQCPECSFRTPQTWHLKKAHQMLHTGFVEWFYCFHCPYKTNWKRSLGCHVKTHRQTGQDK